MISTSNQWHEPNDVEMDCAVVVHATAPGWVLGVIKEFVLPLNY